MTFDFQVILNGLIAGAAYGLMAISFALVYQVNRFFDLTPAIGYVAGAYTAVLIVKTMHWPIGVGLIIGVAVAALIGIVIQFGLLREIQCRRSGASEKFLATLGLLVVIQGVIAVSFGDDTKVLGWYGSSTLEGHGLAMTQPQLATLLVAAMLPILGVFAEWSHAGRIYRAVATDAELALIFGVRVDLVRMAASALSLAIAGLAGVLIGADIGLTPGMGFRAILMGVVAAVIGGIGSFRGVMLGALLIGMTQNLVAWWISSAWQDAATFLLLIIFLIARPQGILGKPLRSTTV